MVDAGSRDVDVVIFRSSTLALLRHNERMENKVKEDPILADLLRDTPFGVVGINGMQVSRPVMGWTPTQMPAAPRGPLDLDWPQIVRGVEARAFLEATNAVRSGPNLHYALPSGIHSDRFISIRRLLSDPVTVERLADWFLEDLAGASGILVDQEAMLPLAFSMQAVALAIWSRPPLVRVIGEYPVDLKTLNDVLLGMDENPTEAESVLFLQSVSLTGRVARMFRTLAADGSRLRIMFSAMGEDGAELDAGPLHRIPVQRLKVGRRGRCTLCRQGYDLYRVDSKTYDVTAVEPGKMLRATRGRVGASARFWGLVDEMDAVRIHFNDPYTQRHHPVYIDVARLLAHPEFRKECLHRLSLLERPGLVIIPGHPASGVIRDLMNEAMPGIKIETLPTGSNRLPADQHYRIAATERVLIADDSIITGRTLTDLKLQIYSMCLSLHRTMALDAFAVLARPAGDRKLKGVRNRLMDDAGAHLHVAWSVNLPYPSKGECPLCLEESVLQRSMLQVSPGVRGAVSNRLRQLRGALRDPLCGDTGERRIGGSFLVKKEHREAGDALPRTVFAAAQSAAITLADEATTRSEEDGQVYRIDDADLLDKFFDAEILGAFLRTLTRKELAWPANDERVVAKLAEFPAKAPAEDLLVELAWAAVLGRLPAEAVGDLLQEAGGGHRVAMMKEVIRVNIP